MPPTEMIGRDDNPPVPAAPRANALRALFVPRLPARWRRDGRAHACVSTGPRTPLGVSGVLAAVPEDHRARHARFALRDVDAVGARADLLLQRCLPAHRRHQARMGAGRARRQGLGGDLARHRAAHRARAASTGRRPGTRRCCCSSSAAASRKRPTTPSRTARCTTTTAASPACCAS